MNDNVVGTIPIIINRHLLVASDNLNRYYPESKGKRSGENNSHTTAAVDKAHILDGLLLRTDMNVLSCLKSQFMLYLLTNELKYINLN